jgi:hypothetical protein
MGIIQSKADTYQLFCSLISVDSGCPHGHGYIQKEATALLTYHRSTANRVSRYYNRLSIFRYARKEQIPMSGASFYTLLVEVFLIESLGCEITLQFPGRLVREDQETPVVVTKHAMKQESYTPFQELLPIAKQLVEKLFELNEKVFAITVESPDIVRLHTTEPIPITDSLETQIIELVKGAVLDGIAVYVKISSPTVPGTS